MCRVSVFLGAGTFQYKIFTLLLVILIIIAFVVTICYYGLEYSEHGQNGIGMLKLRSTPFSF